MKYSQFQFMRLIYASLVTAIIVSMALYQAAYSAFQRGPQAAADWAAHPYFAMLGSAAPGLAGGAIFYWWLGRAKWFRRKFTEKPGLASQEMPAPIVAQAAAQGLAETKVRGLDRFINRNDIPFGSAHDAQSPQTGRPETVSMKKAWQWPTVRTAAIVAVTLALISFLFISNYRPGLSIFGNIMTGYFRYEQPCQNPFDTFDAPCSGYVPYRWILAALAAFVGIVALKQRKR